MPRVPAYSALLTTLAAMLMLPPFLPDGLTGQRLIGVITSAVLIAGALSVHRRFGLMVITGFTVIPALFASWLAYGLENPNIYLAGLVFRCAFHALMIFAITTDILQQKQVTGDTIAGAAAGYIFLALFWAGLYGIVEIIEPGSFSLPSHPSWAGDWAANAGNASSVSFNYFSFVTMTTVGYGDMAPQTAEAGMLAAAEATAGQLYIAVLVARLVAMHVAHQRE